MKRPDMIYKEGMYETETGCSIKYGDVNCKKNTDYEELLKLREEIIKYRKALESNSADLLDIDGDCAMLEDYLHGHESELIGEIRNKLIKMRSEVIALKEKEIL